MNKFEFTNLTPFKWFVLENFPFIEADFDALSEWQLFCKLGKEINKIINSENTLGTQLENVTNAFNNLQNYVDNYFNNLDVQDEINNKLNEMASDGTLANIIEDYAKIPEITEELNNINSKVNSNYTTLNNKIDNNYKELNDKTNNQNENIIKLSDDTDNNKAEINNINTKLLSLSSGSPSGVYATLNDLQNANPDHSKIYVVSDDGNWYYYNNGWVSGGTYQATEDSKAVVLLQTDIFNEINKTDKSLNNEKLIDYALQFEQGRWLTNSDTNVVYKPNEAENVEAIRIRCLEPLKFNVNTKIILTQGYLAEIKILDNDNKLTFNSNWVSAFTIKANQKFVITIRKNDDSSLYAQNNKDYIKMTSLNQIYLNSSNKIRFSSGSYNEQNFNEPILFNNSEAATPIRITTENYINKPFKLKVNDNYQASILTALYNNNLNSVLNGITKDNGTLNIMSKRTFINIKKQDNSNINPEDYEKAINIEFQDGFTFEGGSDGLDDNGYYVENNSDIALRIRIRTTPTKINKPFKITAKEGYSFCIANFDENNKFIDLKKTWIKNYTVPEGIYNIVIKADDESNIFPIYANNYIDIDYDIFTFNERPEHFKKYNVLFIGDSITEENYTATCNWTRILNAQMKFANIKNIATGGTGIIAGGENGWYNKLDNLDSTNYDLILIMGNMNDYSNNIFNNDNLGEFLDNTLNTEYGALNLFLKKLINKYPLSKIGWITSTPRQYRTSDNDNHNPITTEGYLYGLNSVFENANKAIIETCNNYSIPVLDLFNNSNFKVWNEDFRQKYFYDDVNSVHPNDLGNEIIAIKIAEFVNKNF